MKRVKSAVPLEELGITDLRARRAITGALVLEVRGTEGAAKAARLADRMGEVFAGCEGIKVSRPVRTAELRVSGLDDSVIAEEVAVAVSSVGACAVEDVKVEDIKMSPSGMGTAWVRCPVEAAKPLTDQGRVRVGWVNARVQLLPVRPLQCFRCLEMGHIRASCTCDADRSGVCYRCGVAGHLAASCLEAARCPSCAESGLSASHRIGSVPSCRTAKGPKKKGGGSGGAGSAAVRAPSTPAAAKSRGGGAATAMDTKSVPVVSLSRIDAPVPSGLVEAMEVTEE
ncbi:PREDICTED: uncharacterized protein LOC108782493 [Cyphomyrmex costatus]|uniref:uncharacterized protein LOC108782493 n=1 Tax=Cyphomyrmex costatus TaxID=456900 RepID=UPI0008523A07|nr:PREDICTED: uncharacterized protein LOC108782493 [Cyphomyrmex costatus]